MIGPDAATLWAAFFGFAGMLVTGIAWWSYNHRDSYWMVLGSALLCITFLVIPPMTAFIVVEIALYRLHAVLDRSAFEVAKRALAILDFPIEMPMVIYAICGIAIGLQYMPKKDD